MNNSIPLMIHSQNFEITVEDDFCIFLSVTLHKDFPTQNISRLELLNAYVSKVHELYQTEKEYSTLLNNFSQS